MQLFPILSNLNKFVLRLRNALVRILQMFAIHSSPPIIVLEFLTPLFERKIKVCLSIIL